ncbi:hypothetical protein CDAR_457401 [Caerostris darwini]|uniref:Uncharacterized protein n=1 Tax=Caerostris darwini TaxID=1538125 RepID=A0AAV4PE84_9ARAC|nr:hypothetical protein CDAR_457401 [Caerostris darwini]
MRNSGSKSKNVSLNQIAIIFSVDLDEADFCKTCSDHIRKRHVPNLAANYGFRYPEQPSCLSELNDLEERLVALRIPFVQIRELGQDRQMVSRDPLQTFLTTCTNRSTVFLAM